MYRPGDVSYCKHGETNCDECDGIKPPTQLCDVCEQRKPRSEVKLVRQFTRLRHVCAECAGEK